MNVPYHLRGSIWIRIAAFLIDYLLVLFLFMALMLAYTPDSLPTPGDSAETTIQEMLENVRNSADLTNMDPLQRMLEGVGCLIFVCYWLLEIPLHGSIGKRMLQLRIVAQDGKPAGLKARIIRSLIKIAPRAILFIAILSNVPAVLFLYQIALMTFLLSCSMVFRPQREALHDKWARTVVISDTNLRFHQRIEQGDQPRPMATHREAVPTGPHVVVDPISGTSLLWTVGENWPLELHCSCGRYFLIEKVGTYECPNCHTQAAVRSNTSPPPPA